MRCLTKRGCLKHSRLCRGALVCSKCGRAIALQYKFENDIRRVVLPEFSKFRDEISMLKLEASEERDAFVSVIDFSEVDELIDNLRTSDYRIPDVPESELLESECE